MPRTAADQFNATARIEQAELLPGDLVFFQNTAGPGITHVGIYVGGGYMLNAPAENDVVQLMALNTPYWAEHLAGYGRVAVPPAV
jgi:cell wall-associated NlpC family hydrolase